MRRIKLIVAYDGTNYCGWQVQPNGPSIQSTLQAAIEDLVGEKIMLTGASRTDSGVHALGQVAVFDTNKDNIADWKFAMAINQRLSKDIVVQSSEEVAADFHPRYQNVTKTYKYKILNRRYALPNERFDSCFVPQNIDFEAMREAAAVLVGKHDFRNFCSMKTDVESTVRTVYSLNLEKEDDMIVMTITGDGFLYNMVRIITGALLKVGFHQKTAADLKAALESEKRLIAGPTAPAHGLTLVEIHYDGGL